ncbi:MAG: hypothetical protein LUE21_08730 [Oscillospiraceae bacterium]|nr:hypothetical protein [Oscillospiraceae bacterium]
MQSALLGGDDHIPADHDRVDIQKKQQGGGEQSEGGGDFKADCGSPALMLCLPALLAFQLPGFFLLLAFQLAVLFLKPAGLFLLLFQLLLLPLELFLLSVILFFIFPL